MNAENEKLKAELYKRAHEVGKLAAMMEQTAMAGSIGGCPNEQARPKPWVELSIEDKIERTREHAKSLAQELRYVHGRNSELQREVAILRSRLVNHRHQSEDAGRVMIPVEQGECDQYANGAKDCCIEPKPDPSKVYF